MKFDRNNVFNDKLDFLEKVSRGYHPTHVRFIVLLVMFFLRKPMNLMDDFISQFHATCIDPWLRQQGTCPVCKFRVASGWRENGRGIDATFMV